jgi:hypothetical protein
VALYTGIALGSPTPANQGTNYYQMINYSCIDLCLILANDPINPAQNESSLRALRFILLIVSGLALFKEFYQVLTQRDKYFRRFYINCIELHMYVSINYCDLTDYLQVNLNVIFISIERFYNDVVKNIARFLFRK